jgi:hypothetical protein
MDDLGPPGEQRFQLVNENKTKLPPTDKTIRMHMSQFKTSDDPYDVAVEIGEEYGWSQKQIEKAEKLIRSKYIR